MFVRSLLGFIFIAVLSGCATTPPKTSTDVLQNRVVDIERKLEEKDSEIVDLQYQVKDLSSKLEGGSEEASSNVNKEPSDDAAKEDKSSKSANKNNEIIKVNVSAQKVQTALKNAGFYTGKIDGNPGRGTKQAIKEFQKSNNLGSDGVVGPKTWDALKEYLK